MLVAFYPLGKNEQVMLTATVLPSLLGSATPGTGSAGVSPRPEGKMEQVISLPEQNRPFKAAFFLQQGRATAIRPLPPARSGEKSRENLLPGPGWRYLPCPDDQLLVPAFVDCHLHLALDGIEGFRSFTAPPTSSALFARLRALAAAGVLALRDGGDLYGSALTARRLLAEADAGPVQQAALLPRIIATGPALFRRGHYGAKLGGKGLDGLAELEKEIRERKEAGAMQLKVILSGLVSLQEPGKVGSLQFSLSELQEIVRLASFYGLPVMAHASSDAAVRLAALAGVGSVEHGYFVREETLQLLAEKGVAWVPTLAPLAVLAGITGPAEAEEGPKPDKQGTPAREAAPAPFLATLLEEHLRMIGRASELGVKIAVGTDSGAPGVGFGRGYWTELALLARAGFSPSGLLELAAVNGAAVLGLEEERGLIAPGKPPCWLCLDRSFLDGKIAPQTLKGIIGVT